MNVSQADRTHGARCCVSGGDEQALMECAQIEAPVEAIAERGKVTPMQLT